MLKSLKKVVSLTLIASMVACSSTPLSHEPAVNAVKSSRNVKDKISHFMLSQDGKMLMMMGSKHHYTFEVNEDVGAILNWASKEKLRASLYGASSTDGKNISLKYKLVVPAAEVTPDEIAFLEAHSFFRFIDNKSYIHDGELSGQYYKANDVDLSSFGKFKKDYTLVYEEQYVQPARYRSTAENTGNSLLFLGVILVMAPIALVLSPLQLFKNNKYSH